MGDVIRLVVVDDDPLVRSGLELILGGAADLEVVAQAADGAAGVEAVREHGPDIVLMDVRMPVLDGIEATEQITALAGPSKVIVLTTFGVEDHVLRALSSGAAGFLLKDTPPADIVDAVRRVAAGEPMLSPAVTRTLIAQVARQGTSARTQAARDRLETLTEREREVADAVGRGLSNAEIGRELYLSVPTVKAHVSRLFDKLGVDNRVQVALCLHDADQR